MIQLPLEQAQAIRAYLGTRPFDEVAAACVWLDAAIRATQQPKPQPQEPSDAR